MFVAQQIHQMPFGYFFFVVLIWQMVVFPNAKINVGLNIISKRADGFHDLESVFYPIPWYDTLEIVETNESFEFTSSGINIPESKKGNLCIQAYEILANEFELAPVKMHLHKIIPIGAGLGGGSADGAYCLKAINQLCKLGLSKAELLLFAAKLGSDCPFFIDNKPAFVTGRGEVFESIVEVLNGYYLVLVNPKVHIGTKEAYAKITPGEPLDYLKGNIIGSPISQWANTVTNQFEDAMKESHSIIGQLKQQLLNMGAKYASMTGTGSTVYGLFEKEITIKGNDFNGCIVYRCWL